MRFISTRGDCPSVSLGQALSAGLAPDGGLYIPERFPRFELSDFDSAEDPCSVGLRLLKPFFEGSDLADALPDILTQALNFPIPRVATRLQGLELLELFHGPTAAFKDVGARFLAGCLERDPRSDGLTVLVATSGDTGGAVASAFEGRTIAVAILFPGGMVSPRQEHQLCCWRSPIRSFRVAGTFDDCQRLVKAAFVDAELNAHRPLTSANSISIGRLLPQMIYYAHAALDVHRCTGEPAHFIIPTGNLGNALACIWARHLGLPIGRIVFATNANRVIARYFETGHWLPGDTIATLASAMDVGNPSNMERLRRLVPELADLSRDVDACSVDDPDIRDTIAWSGRELGLAVCPHTATALQAWRWLRERGDTTPWVAVATAHPAKFEQVVEPIIGESVPVPEALDELLRRPVRCDEIGTDLSDLRVELMK